MVDQSKKEKTSGKDVAMENKVFKGKYISILAVTVLMVLCFVFASANTAHAAGFNGKLPVKQIFESYSGSDGVLGGEFEYTFTPLNGEPALNGFTLKGNEEKKLDYTFEKAGVYEYLLKVVKGGEKGYTWDETEYTVRFYMGNSSTTVTITNNSTGEKVDTALFTHSYAPDRAVVPVDPPVVKVIDGNPPKDAEFVFKLIAADSANPMPEGSANGEKSLTIKGAGKSEFGKWYYDHVGTYSYTVVEVNTKEDGYTYDKTQYSFTDTVTDNNGTLTVKRTINKGDGNSFVFTNEYDDSTPLAPVKTGDSNGMKLFITIFAAALAGIIITANKRKRDTDK